jgi:predicted nuclease of restriction endonuclease-like (RecB) superfamily
MVNRCRAWSSATPYILDFLNLSDRSSERDLETAIRRGIEAFLLEMGSGFRRAQSHRIP